MKLLSWCKSQQQGIKMRDADSTISQSYVQSAQDNILQMTQVDGKWKVVIAYYACYEAIYSLLTRCGIYCEIHDCTLSLMPILGFTKEDVAFMTELKKCRIGVQYYLEKHDVDIQRVKKFVQNCLGKLETLSVEDVREEVSRK